MGRPKGSKNSGIRKAARTPWETYNDWYDKYTKNGNEHRFYAKYTQAEFELEYELAREAKLQNPARSVARSQAIVSKKFAKGYKKFFGVDMPDISNEEDRVNIFLDYIDEQRKLGVDDDEARKTLESYLY